MLAKAQVVRDAVEEAPHVGFPATALHKLPRAAFFLTEGAAKLLSQRQLATLRALPAVDDTVLERVLVSLSVRLRGHCRRRLLLFESGDCLGSAGGMALIPPGMALEDLDQILPRLVDNGLPDGGEFLVVSLHDDDRLRKLVHLLVWHGFLPMGGGGMLLPKIHLERMHIRMARVATQCPAQSLRTLAAARPVIKPGSVHVGRKVRRRAKDFQLTFNQAWHVVVQSKHTFTNRKGDCWLTDELSQVYQAANSVSGKWHREGIQMRWRHPSRGVGWRISFHSVELWHKASGELVAGEIGYTCGAVYSSCTGFALKEQFPGAGSVQLASLGRWLERCGFEIWDLGMEILGQDAAYEMDYKLELGGKSVPRDEWAGHIRRLRDVVVPLRQPHGDEGEAGRLLAGDPAGPAAGEALAPVAAASRPP
ncbi:unnamed protein product [Prorocentrum cordatum]|uniref:Uncharacterized protein n=1 Tax=Prorocentrum cordatum TaxID=2364126 RepID=A0ABN9S5J5_9DINO|nr:unnamed protein product [Polarella glacialis]